jgi:transposase InsO family protein
MRGKYSVKALCRALDIKKSIYYHHHRKPKTYIERQDEILKPILLNLYHFHRKAVGSKKLRFYMKRQGIEISKKRVQRLMRELNIAKLLTNKPRFHYQHLHKKSCLNLLNRDFNMPAPNHAWVSYIKYVLVGKRFMYICVIIDLFSRLVLSYKISNRITTEIVIDAFSEAYKRRNRPENLIFHSDLGSQYTSTKFKDYLLSPEIRQSFSATASPYDNAVAESFFATYKREYIDLCGPFSYVRKFKITNKDFINWYNNERIHESLEYLTPMEKEEQFDRDFPGFRNKVESGKFQF